MLPDDEFNALLRNARAERFAPGFSGRVLRRTIALREQTLAAGLQRYFYWMVPAAVTAIAPPITNARLGSQRPPNRSRKPMTFPGWVIPEIPRPRPNTIPDSAAMKGRRITGLRGCEPGSRSRFPRASACR